MKHYIFILLSVSIYNSMFSQKDSIYVKNNDDIFIDYFKGVTVNGGVGLFLPQRDLNNYFGIAPVIEIDVNFPIKEKTSIDLGLQFIIPNQKESFTYIRTIDTLDVKSQYMFNFFVRYKKRINQNLKSDLNFNIGLGVSTIATDARNPFFEGEKDQKKYEMVSAILVLPGFEYKCKFSKEATFIIGLDLQYSPYKIEGSVREDIGSIALIPKILYRF
ncbi:hypothetical protein [Ichthyenterobacterium magnum]|uniref:Outer membrane protein with beta-barrel domain n=1 Tax=Ichthyenterobacterium magnum TaxID=1230530 RepID=A0A420DVU3_9FLAO|nr:hypothetical protein [Ichthyenterobacterium magnum]RKE98348.1 hypothetical protein BXY80_0431 [Ichthyenterobacterium magnum]